MVEQDKGDGVGWRQTAASDASGRYTPCPPFPHGPDMHPHRTTANPSAHRKGSERKSAHQDDRQDDRAPRHHIAVTVAAATTHAVRMVVGSRASPVAVNGASGKGITKAAAPLRPWDSRGSTGECRGILIDYSTC